MIVQHQVTNVAINPGDEITDFRGDTHIYRQITVEPDWPHKSGKILTNQGEYFPGVFDLKIIDDQG